MSADAVRFLSLQNVLRIHEDTLAHEGGAAGTRDEGLLASALEIPQATFEGRYVHADLAGMAAAYLYHICQNHAFLDGNKRTAAFSTVVFLALNGVPDEALPDPSELESLTMRVAAGEMSNPAAAAFLRDSECHTPSDRV